MEEKTFVNVQEYYYFFPPQFRSNFKAIAKNTNCNTLFLSKTRTENVSITDDVFNWFDHLKILHDFGTDIEDMKETSESLLNDPILHQLIFKMLLSTDSSIKDIQIPQEEYHIVNFEKIINSDRKKPLKSVINDELFLEPKIIRNNIAFDLMEEESEGTKKIFALIGPILKILKEGCVLFYDELDVKIHPNLALFLIKLFNNEKNQSAQLIFTTHNTFFLNNDIFRRDQIWFTGKKIPEELDSFLYSLLEFKPRKDKNLENGYLAGRYGAIPFIPYGCVNLWEDLDQQKEDSNQLDHNMI